MIRIVPYEDHQADAWDHFVGEQSANGTVFHTRRFLSYHRARVFQDHSIMMYESDTLVAVVAAALTEDGGYFSHPGTSCGGPVIHKDYFKIADIMEILQAVEHHYDHRLGMRLCEDFLIPYSNAPLLYHFARSCDVRFELSSFKELGDRPLVETIRGGSTRSAVRKIFRERDCFQLAATSDDYLNYHSVLTENLRKHDATPTHSREEFLTLRDVLGDDQSLLLCIDADGTIACGVWVIKATSRTWHAQYIAKHSQCSLPSIVEATLITAMELAAKNNAEYFSLGISTESGGSKLNIGLSRFKEKLGCRFENRYLLTPRE